MDKRLYYIANAAVSLVLLMLLLVYSGFDPSIVLAIDPLPLIPAYLFMLVATLLIALSLHVSLVVQGEHIGVGRSIAANFGAQFFSDITPARLGYFIVPLLLKRYGVRSSSGIASALIVGAVNAMVKGLFAAASVMLIIGVIEMSIIDYILLFMGAAMLIAMSSLLLIIVRPRFFCYLDRFLADIPVIGGLYRRRLAETVKRSVESLSATGYKALYTTPLLALSLLSNAASLYFIVLAAGYPISFSTAVIISSLATLLMYVPISIGGIGVQENANTILLYMLASIPLSHGAAISLIYRGILLLADLPGIYILVSELVGSELSKILSASKLNVSSRE